MTKGHVAREIVLWLVALFLALVCLRSGFMKMPGAPGEPFWIRDSQGWGYPDAFRLVVGAAELLSGVLLLVPRTAGYGALVFAIVMIGAIGTHATHDEAGRLPFNLLLLALSSVLFFARPPARLQWTQPWSRRKRS